MGSAFRRCDYNSKKWMIDTTITFEDGTRRHLKRRGYLTKSAAMADFDRVVAEFKKQSGFNPSKTFFNDLVELFLNFEVNRVKESTFLSKKTIFDRYIIPFFENTKIKNTFTISKLNNFKNSIKNLDLSVDRKNKILSHMKYLAKFCYSRDFISEKDFKMVNNVCERFPAEIKAPAKYTVWSFAQYQKFIKTFKTNDKYRVFFQFMFYSGLRIGEALAILWKDLDVENQLIHIYKSISNNTRRGEAIITTTKNISANRSIYLNEDMLKELLDLKEAYGSDPERFMFFGGKNPIGRTTVRRVFNKHIKIANLPHLKIHEIRHTNNTWLLNMSNSRASADIVTKRLGRSSLAVTLDNYYHTSMEEEIELLDKFKIE